MGNFIFGGGSKSLNKGGLLTYRGRQVLPLSFTLQPQAKTVDEYALATFSCEVTGGVAPYSYQWKKNGTNVGTNSANLSFTAAAADKNASITVVVTDSAGAVITSTPVVLGVVASPSQRYFSTISPASFGYYDIQNPIQIIGDFNISFDIYPSTENFQTILSLSPSFDVFIRLTNISTTPLMAINIGGYESGVAIPSIVASQLNSCVISRAGSTITITVNGVVDGSVSQTEWGNPVTFDTIGAIGNYSQNVDGILANIAIDDLSNQENSQFWPIANAISQDTEQSNSGDNVLTAYNISNRELFDKVADTWVGSTSGRVLVIAS